MSDPSPSDPSPSDPVPAARGCVDAGESAPANPAGAEPVAGWEARIATFWATFDDADPEGALAAMRVLVGQRPPEDPAAWAEWAGVHDSLGREAQAIPLYRQALAAGLTGPRRAQVVVQLASSLRNVGEVDSAVELLSNRAADPELGSAPDAFLALALFDAGRPAEALRLALTALAPTLPRYGRAVRAYAEELTDEPGHRPR